MTPNIAAGRLCAEVVSMDAMAKFPGWLDGANCDVGPLC
jgi:hypothetical protein